MNGIITLSDGAGTTISNGQVLTNDFSGNTITTGSLNTGSISAADLNLTGSLEVPAVNDIPVSGLATSLVSFKNTGQSYFTDRVEFQNSVYTTSFIPRSLTAGSSLCIGSGAMQNQSSTSTECVAVGNDALHGLTAGTNSIQRTVAIGNNALDLTSFGTSTNTVADNVIIGYNACKGNYSGNNINNVIIGSKISQNGAGVNQNSVIIGAGIGATTGAVYDRSVVIGAGNLPSTAVNGAVVIGSSNFSDSTFGYANGGVILGYNNCTYVSSYNRLCVIGDNAGQNVSNDAATLCIGSEVGNGIVSGFLNTFIGAYGANTNNGAVSNVTNIGTGSYCDDNNTFMIGGNDLNFFGLGYTRYQDLCIKNKNRVLCGYQTNDASVSLSFEQPEYIFITGSTTTSITLPSPASNFPQNCGARFTIVRAYTGSYVAITINAPSGQTIIYNGVASSTFAFSTNDNFVQLACIDTSTAAKSWAVVSTPRNTNVVDLTTNQTIAGIKTFSSPPVMSGASITAGTIPGSAFVSGYVDLLTNQAVAGVKTFSSAPSMSGASISSGTVPVASIVGTAVNLNGVQTISAVKTFTAAPVLSGASINTGTIPLAAVAGTAMDLTTTQSCSGLKTFTGRLSMQSSAYESLLISTSGAYTISAPYYNVYRINTTGTITITLPAASSSLANFIMKFRRISTAAFAVNVASPGFYPITSHTVASTVLLTASSTTQAGNCISIICAELITSGVYTWYEILG